MEVIKVSPRLNKATNNSPSFIQPYEEDAEEQSEDVQESTGQLSFFD